MSAPLDIRAGSNPAYPSGPKLLRRIASRILLGTARRQTPADFMRSVAREHGDLNYYAVGNRRIYQLNHPDLVADFFGRDAKHHHRNLAMRQARDVLGNGLLTSEEPLHMRQRRLAQPAFLRQRIAGYGEVIGSKTLAMTAQWKSGTIVNMHTQMLELALCIVGKCLFDLDEVEDMAAMESAVNAFMNLLPLSFLPFNKLIQRLPIAPMRRLRDGKQHLDRLIYGILAERRADPRDRGDLLSMLLNASDTGADTSADTDTSADNAPQRMTDTQLRDECVTVILAGHETTANALSFALALLARHPDVQQRLHDEAAEALHDNAPTAAHYTKLPYATQVFAEAMRLYPPVWVTGRMAAEPYDIAGFHVAAGASIMAPQYAVHTDERWWPDPLRFDPERFTEAAKATRPRNAYFPFGGGSRQCIAEGLAWMEGTLALAAIARDWQLSLPPGQPAHIDCKASITLRPADSVPLLVTRR